MPAETVKARVLRATTIAGVDYLPDAVAPVPGEIVDALYRDGAIDPHPAAVAYAESLAPAPAAAPVLEG